MYIVWWVDLPGTQSSFRASPGMNQECITSKLFVIIVIGVSVGRIICLFTHRSLFLSGYI